MFGHGPRRTRTASTMDDTVYNIRCRESKNTSSSMPRVKSYVHAATLLTATRRDCHDGSDRITQSLPLQSRKGDELEPSRETTRAALHALLDALRGVKLMREALREELVLLGRPEAAARMGGLSKERLPAIATTNPLSQRRSEQPTTAISWTIPANKKTESSGRSQRSARRSVKNIGSECRGDQRCGPDAQRDFRLALDERPVTAHTRSGSYMQILEKQRRREDVRRVRRHASQTGKKYTLPPSGIPRPPTSTGRIAKRTVPRRETKIPGPPCRRRVDTFEPTDTQSDAFCNVKLCQQRSRSTWLDTQTCPGKERMDDLTAEIARIDIHLCQVQRGSRSQSPSMRSATRSLPDVYRSRKQPPKIARLPRVAKQSAGAERAGIRALFREPSETCRRGQSKAVERRRPVRLGVSNRSRPQKRLL